MASTKKPRQSELSDRLTTFLRETVQPGQTLLVGLSGGLDSCVLLHLLAAARASHGFRLEALHVNHGISPNAALWAEFCTRLCHGYAVSFAAAEIEVPRDSGLGIEAAAREARYRILLSQSADALILAHHRDDQAETVLLQLLRGSGVKGLAAMPEHYQKSASSMPILRPLLDVARCELESYARAHALEWVEDESNLDLAYDRNFLRHHVFPEIEKRFPAARTTLARSAGHFSEAAALLDEIAVADAAQYVDAGHLNIAGLRMLSAARGRNLLRFWLSGYLSAPPSTRRLQELHRQLINARQDARLLVKVRGGEVRRYRDHAIFETNPGVAPVHLSWQGEPEIQLPTGVLTFRRALGQGLSVAHTPGRLEIRSRTGGERFRPNGKRPTRSLRHLLQEAGIPPWERAALPMIYAEERLVAVPGVGVACDLQAAPDEEGWLIGWMRG